MENAKNILSQYIDSDASLSLNNDKLNNIANAISDALGQRKLRSKARLNESARSDLGENFNESRILKRISEVIKS